MIIKMKQTQHLYYVIKGIFKPIHILYVKDSHGISTDQAQSSRASGRVYFVVQVNIFDSHLGPLLLTWFNFNPSMDKQSHTL